MLAKRPRNWSASFNRFEQQQAAHKAVRDALKAC